MRKTIIIIVLLAWIAAVPVLKGDESGQLFWQNKVIEAELPLAKTDSVYFVLDEAAGLMLFKAKGIVLREWKISAFHGRPAAWPILSTALLKKEALAVPKRKLIDPKNPKTAEEIGSYALDSLESKDMPADYFLLLANDIQIHISSGREKLLTFLGHLRYFFDQALHERAREIWEAAFKPKETLLRVYFEDPAEARMLGWSLSDGMKGLILFKTN